MIRITRPRALLFLLLGQYNHNRTGITSIKVKIYQLASNCIFSRSTNEVARVIVHWRPFLSRKTTWVTMGELYISFNARLIAERFDSWLGTPISDNFSVPLNNEIFRRERGFSSRASCCFICVYSEPLTSTSSNVDLPKM